MHSCIVQTDFQQVSETHCLFNIPDADNINHIVVFMTGQTPFPDGMGGAVYFSWAGPEGTSWHLLGHISNNKPSAIFKVSSLKKGEGSTVTPFATYGVNHAAQIGISAEPLDQLSGHTPAANTVPSAAESFTEFSKRMLENFYNYASSFAITQAQMTPTPSQTYVPLSTLTSWFSNFERKLQQNPYFWRS
ncbi:hypothetical protein CAPTEDRAFT_191635 [Capitella teleta]|uniref:Uncharacterized protein n=1 Tax=Capitella teleta TaxID=283909 RepID=R7UAT3_CAPTE|nr:hypothetical protein CAPTEDRAFT_191635 [Capitella teleta]|eukprot:ELU03246.1 hypothetical protein CAPTEDRAFT_191635 [Capitella teleta]